MKKYIFSFLATLLLLGCATTNKSPPTLYEAYLLYSESTSEDNISHIANRYFSVSLLGDKYLTNPDASSQLLFKKYMNSVVNHYEQINNQNGCLTINGYDEEKAPILFSLKYIKNNGRWLIEEIHVVFIESINDFSKEAKCPESYIN